MKRTRTWLRLLLTLAAVGLYGSCRELDVTAVDPVSVEVTPTAETVGVGQARQFEAVARDAAGNELRGRSVSWSVADDAVAQVNVNGTVTGVAPGTTTLMASVGGASGQATVTVVERPVATVEVEPASTTLEVGATVQLEVTLRAEDGDVVTGPEVTFTSGDPAVAEVSATGLVTAVSNGSTTITATAEAESGQASITVSPGAVETVSIAPPTATVAVGASTTLEAILRAADGSIVTGITPTWSSSDPAIASVDAAGRVTGEASGTATITATVPGATGQATITVVEQGVAGLALNPSSATLFVGATLMLEATVTASDGSELNDRPVTYTSLDPAIATVDLEGLVTAVAPGSVNIVATAESVSDTATVFVQAQPIAEIEVEPATASIFVGDVLQLTVTLTAADGTPLTGRVIDWTSDDEDVATVDDDGAVTALAPGTAQITATSEGKSASSEITVGARVASVSIAPNPVPGLFPGQSGELTATVFDDDQQPITTYPVEWTVDDGVLQLTASGSFNQTAAITALALPSPCPSGQTSCTTTVAATANEFEGETTVPVLKPVANVNLGNNPATMSPGATLQLNAELRADDNTNLTGLREVTWSTSNDAVAGVDESGEVTANGAPCAQSTCSAVIRASAINNPGSGSDDVFDEVTVTVRKPVESVTISPASPSAIFAGGQVALTASVQASGGGTITDRPVTWTAAPASGVVSISTSGSANLEATVTASSTPSCSGAVCTVRITATVDDVSDEVTVRVRKRVTQVNVTPATSSIEASGAGATVQLTAQLMSGSQDITGAPNAPTVTWESSNPAFATVNGSGLVTGQSAGCAAGMQSCEVTITAEVLNGPGSSDNVSGTAAVDVRKPVATVTISPQNHEMAIGETEPFTASVQAADGTNLTSRTVTWEATPGGILQLSSTTGASIDAEAVADGSVTLTASAGGQEGQSTVEVGPVIVDIEFDVASPTLMPGQQLVINATPVDGNGDPVPGERVDWDDVPDDVMQVLLTPDGRSATITLLPNPALCEAGTESCTETLTVSAGPVVKQLVITWFKPVDQVLMSPLDVNLSVLLIPSQREETFTVELFAADGTQLDASNRTIAWSVSSDAVQISPTTGPSTTATANLVGQATLSAVAEGITSLQSAVINVGL